VKICTNLPDFMQTSNSLSTANLLRPLAEKRLPYSIIFNSTKSTIEAVCDDIAAAKEVTANRSTFAQEALAHGAKWMRISVGGQVYATIEVAATLDHARRGGKLSDGSLVVNASPERV
jgi:hypothetical protein